MPDKKLTDVTDNNVGKMTDNDIKSHLEWLKTVVDRVDSITNGKEFISTVIDYINRLEVENERLKENLNIELENFASEYDSKIKAEAYKECIEKVKAISCKLNMCHKDVVLKTDYQISGEALGNLLKELVGEDK